MISDSATLVLFAIRSAIKLGQQSRQAYVDSTRRRELTLPLPNFFVATDADDAVGFFRNPGLGKKYVEGYAADGRPVPTDTVLAALLPQYNPLAPVREVERRLMDYHRTTWAISSRCLRRSTARTGTRTRPGTRGCNAGRRTTTWSPPTVADRGAARKAHGFTVRILDLSCGRLGATPCW